MEDFLREFNSIDWRTYDTFAALSAFDSYWRESERLIKDGGDIEELLYGPNWSPKDEDEVSEILAERRVVRHLHDEIITPTFRYSTVVTLFAVVERELRRFADNSADELKANLSYKDLRGALLEQISKHSHAFRGFSLSELTTYTRVCDLQKVRDCLVHCHGDVSLSRDKAHLLRLSSPINGIFAHEGIDLEVSPSFIENSYSAVWLLFSEIFQRVGWKIHDRWQEKGKGYR
jgi:hypothetical protein